MACKIKHEATLLYGSNRIFYKHNRMLRDYAVTAKLQAMERRALLFRTQAERRLLNDDPEESGLEGAHLFYPAEESEELE